MTQFQSGVDVSRYQGKIDWVQVARAGKQFSIIRAVSSNNAGPYVDPFYLQNVTGAADAGLRVGAYYYTYATTTAYADREIALLLRTLQGKQFQYPIFIDVEDNSLKPLGRTRITQLVLYALEKIKAGGYYAGVYTYTDFLVDYLDMALLKGYPLYLADYDTPVAYQRQYDLLQYTDNGRVEGITGKVDLDASYVDFLPTIQAQGLNGYSATDTPVEMVPTPNLSLVVYGNKNCQYFYTANVNDIVGTLKPGTYATVAQSLGCYNGFSWVTVVVKGKTYWTALLADRCYLIRA